MFSADLGVQAAGAPPFTGTQFLAAAVVNSPYVRLYPWTSSGFGTAYSNPASLPATIPNACAFTPTGSTVGNFVAFVGGGSADPKSSSPFFTAVYPFSISGFGARTSQPTLIPSAYAISCAFSGNGQTLIVGSEVSARDTYMNAYAWNGAGFVTRRGDPASGSSNSAPAADIAFNPSGTVVVAALSGGQRLNAFSWTDVSGFGSKFSNPSPLPAGGVLGIAFSPSGDVIAAAVDTSPFLQAYAWSGTGFGSIFSSPSTLAGSTATGVAFSPAGNAIALSTNSSPFIHAYAWSGSGFGSKFSNPSTIPPNAANRCAFSLDGNAVAVCHSGSPSVTVYAWSGAGFGAKFSNPSVIPDVTGSRGCAFGVIP